MINNYLIQFSIEWYPDASNDIMSIFHVNIKDNANPNAANIILQKHYPHTIFYWSFTNIPGSYVFMVWTPTTKELKDIRESIEQEPAVRSVAPNMILHWAIYSRIGEMKSPNSTPIEFMDSRNGGRSCRVLLQMHSAHRLQQSTQTTQEENEISQRIIRLYLQIV